MPRIVCNAATTGPMSSPAASLDLRRQPIAPGRGGLDRRDVVLEHDMMHRLRERQPAAVSLSPRLDPWGDAAWSKPAAHDGSPAATESPRAAGAPAQRMHRVETARTRSRIASCAASGTHTAVSSPPGAAAPDWPHPADPS